MIIDIEQAPGQLVFNPDFRQIFRDDLATLFQKAYERVLSAAGASVVDSKLILCGLIRDMAKIRPKFFEESGCGIDHILHRSVHVFENQDVLESNRWHAMFVAGAAEVSKSFLKSESGTIEFDLVTIEQMIRLLCIRSDRTFTESDLTVLYKRAEAIYNSALERKESFKGAFLSTQQRIIIPNFIVIKNAEEEN